MAKNIVINVDINTKDGEKSIGDLNNEMKTTLTTLGQMEDASALLNEELRKVEVGSEAYSKLKDELIKVNTEIKNQELAMEALDNEQVASEIAGVVGGLTNMAGGLALVGVSGEGIEKVAETFIKIESAQRLVTGSMEVYNGVRKLSNAIDIKSNLIKGINVVKTVALAAANGIATAAQWALNAAMTANPIGLIVTAIGLLIAGILYLTDSFDAIIDAVVDFGLSLLSLIPGFNLIMDLYSKFFGEEARLLEESTANNKKRVEELEKETAHLQAIDKERKAKFASESKGIQDSIDLLNAKGENTEEQSKRLIQLNIDEAKSAKKNAFQQIKAIREVIKLKIKLGDITEEESAKLKDEIISLRKTYDESGEIVRTSENKITAIQTEEQNKRIEAGKKYRARVLKAEEELAKLKINAITDATEKSIAGINSQYDKRISTLSPNIKAEADLIIALNKERDAKIAAENKKVTDKAAADKAIADAKVAADTIKAKELTAKTLLETEQALFEDKISLMELEISMADEKGQLLIDLEQTKYNQELIDLKASLANKEISEEQYNSNLNVLDKTHLATKTELEKAQAQEHKDIQLEKANSVLEYVQLAGDFINMLGDIEQERIQGELDALETAADKKNEILQRQLDNGLITQREFDLQAEKDEAKKEAKSLALRKQAFESKKKTDLLSAGINTALGITSALGAPFPISIVMAALAAATGAIQISKISGSTFKAAEGGIVPGTPSNVDSVNSLLAPGEIVINSNSAQMFGSELSAINQAGGGKQLIPNNIGSGGNSKSTPIVKAYIVETEISESQKGVRKIEDLATF